ncbi:MAG: hypothetical protein AB3N21_06295 [Ruegeria sp.]|uniref:ATP-binding protein n=1 Tax=Ruegeria sp. TaxID=1879320 RepID=UPI00349EB766
MKTVGVTSPEDRHAIERCIGLADRDLSRGDFLEGTDILQALGNYLEARAASGPLLAMVEDMQWADAITERLFQLAGAIAERSIMLVLTGRPEFDHSAFNGFDPTVLSLSRLTRWQVTDLVNELSRPTELSADMIDAVCDRSDGVPLFVEELVRSIIQNSPDRAWVPSTLKDALTARLNELGVFRHFAYRASCFGRRFSADLLSRVCNDLYGTVEDVLDAIMAAGLIFRRSGLGPQTYCFKHALLREAAYESLPISVRQSIHRTIHETLIKHPETQPDIVAWHADRARETREAFAHRSEIEA